MKAFYRRYNECCNAHEFDRLGEFVADTVEVNGSVRTLAEYMAERDPGKRKAIAERLQVLAHDNANIVLLGQVAAPAAYRSNLKDMINIGFPIAWNVRRTN